MTWKSRFIVDNVCCIRSTGLMGPDTERGGCVGDDRNEMFRVAFGRLGRLASRTTLELFIRYNGRARCSRKSIQKLSMACCSRLSECAGNRVTGQEKN